MSFGAKQRSKQHLIDDAGQKLFRSQVPPHWVVHEYRPDYGIDFTLEVFSKSKEKKSATTYETLGEHVFIQLKSVNETNIRTLKLYERKSVEKFSDGSGNEVLVGEINTVRFQLEIQELVTVERMGVGVPVLLVVADLSKEKCYFVCLNDYIDKILIPRHQNYRNKATRSIHIPVLNDLTCLNSGNPAIRWYAKRPKLFAAFQRFVFQQAELEYSRQSQDGPRLAKYFAERIASYDFWDDTEMWPIIRDCGAAVRRFLTTDEPRYMEVTADIINRRITNGDKPETEETARELEMAEICQLWRLLSTLPRNYEDICREWFLPTSLGFLTSYS